MKRPWILFCAFAAGILVTVAHALVLIAIIFGRGFAASAPSLAEEIFAGLWMFPFFGDYAWLALFMSLVWGGLAGLLVYFVLSEWADRIGESRESDD